MRLFLLLLAGWCLPFIPLQAEDYSAWSGHGWSGHGSVWLLTDKDGADLSATAVVKEFPVVLRLHGDTFPFASAQVDGADLRVTDASGRSLALEIESWDKAAGEAVVWVRVPEIRGATRQELKLHWGNPQAKAVSDGSKVFSRDNGYLSVWHMGQEVKDAVGTLPSKVVGTKPIEGLIGGARSFAGKEGVFSGDKITGYPTDASSHTTSAWIKPTRSNTTIIAWGNEAGGRGSKVRFQLRAPQHLHIDSNFSDVDGPSNLTPDEWHYVTHTYDKNDGRLYLDGKLDGKASPMLNIKSPARLWIGGWYDVYSYEGAMDEVRVSSVARSPEWIKLEYANQAPNQCLVGHVVMQGGEVTLTADRLVLNQGETVTYKANVPGALSVSWTGAQGQLIAGRTGFSETLDLLPPGKAEFRGICRLWAVLPQGVIEKSVEVTWKRVFPEPVLKLNAPQAWDGRTELRLKLDVVNGEQLKVLKDGQRTYRWQISGAPVISEVDGDTLILKRAMGAGRLNIAAFFSSQRAGGEQVGTEILVAEQPLDPWLARPEPAEELPMDGQFYAREGDGLGRLYCKGTLAADAQKVTLKLYADDKFVADATQAPKEGKGYRFVQALKPGLIRYRVELLADGKPVHAATDLVCGDAFIIQGQSNAVANDFGKENPLQPNPWVRTFGATDGSPNGSRLKLWGSAEARARGGRLEIGYWGMELGRRLVESQHIPICLINGAVGGTRIDMHQRDTADPTNATTIYGRLLWRVRAAGLDYGIRGILWHQGENDQGADGPDGTFGFVHYRKYFDQMAGSWRQDYPNAQRLHLFQIWPKSCAMGINGSDNYLREEQRKLKTAYASLDIMPTLGIRPPGGCHFPAAGYAEFAKLMTPLIERDHYGVKNVQSVSAPNILSVQCVGDKQDAVVLTFDQPVVWRDDLVAEFSFVVDTGFATLTSSVKVVGGSAQGSTLTLRLSEGLPKGSSISYLDSKNWSQDRLLMGANGLPALTFRSVPIR
ncbi:MAG: hypothetical protein RL492_1362 [Verrucomicrobiota bacterium]